MQLAHYVFFQAEIGQSTGDCNNDRAHQTGLNASNQNNRIGRRKNPSGTRFASLVARLSIRNIIETTKDHHDAFSYIVIRSAG
jgi:hypothetical protein